MFNKIYKGLANYIRENIVEIVVYIFLLFIVLCPVNYYIITGGGTFDAGARVKIANSNKSSGSFNMAYVSEIKGTIFTYLLSYVIPSYDRESVDEYKASSTESVSDIEFRNTLWLRQTNNNAIYVAYNAAGKDISLKSKKNYIFYVTDKAKTNLKVGDEVLKIDNTSIASFNELKSYISTKSIGDKVIFKIKRDNKEYEKYAYIYEEEDNLYAGITLLEDDIYNTKPKVSFNFRRSESGPSGGLIMTLEIYNMLTKKDITKGLKIVGTGTIDKDGTVGEIDGIKYKLRGAVKNKADVFLAPTGRNYKEAVKEKEKNNYKIKIVEVKSFEDAINKLSKLKG